ARGEAEIPPRCVALSLPLVGRVAPKASGGGGGRLSASGGIPTPGGSRWGSGGRHRVGGGLHRPTRSRQGADLPHPPLPTPPRPRQMRPMSESLAHAPPPGARDPADVLRETFGHAAFRGQQEAVVRHLTEGGDAVVLFPTGAGKSVCYQVPALCRPGVGIVVSPLIALMRDQVEALRQAGVSAATLNSALTSAESAEVRRALARGELDLLYVAPERLTT